MNPTWKPRYATKYVNFYFNPLPNLVYDPPYQVIATVQATTNDLLW